MGGSGGGGFRSGRSSSELANEVSRSLQQAELERDVNALLAAKLSEINNRDVDLIGRRLDEIKDALGDKLADFDRLLFGGSVSKHTYVDGLSDVDSLVVLKPEALDGDSPQALRAAIERALRERLDMGKVAEIKTDFAVTIRYTDGSEVQLLPAVQRGDGVSISDKTGEGWSFIRPKAFQERLTAVNERQDRRVVPTIKLAKSIVESLPETERPGGYHMEALAVEAFSDYEGPRNTRAMLTHFFRSAGQRIRQPIADATGQSSRLDETFGVAESPARQRVSVALRRIASRMESATDVEQWRKLVE